jgi:hypothetical protein
LHNLTPAYTKLTDKGVSFGVLRTNPKLTSNLKLTVDSDGNLWFNSIDATPELAQSKYKNFAIDQNSSHEVNLFKFYDGGKTPTQISFAVGSTITVGTVAKDLKDQYDFDLYSSGAKYLSSKNYREKFSYFAPLYLDTIIPECFVILKIPAASNYTVGEWKQKLADPNFTRTQFVLDLFRNASVVKNICLTETSKIGTYIRNILKNPMYPRNPLYVNFKNDRYSVYRGASIGAGTYVEIPELLSSTLRKSIPQIKLEKYITEGFERNNIVYPRIINLEFLFDDDDSDPYTFNRYLGFYCNLIDLAAFTTDIESMYENEDDNDNQLPFRFREEDEVSVNITNSNGVVLRGIGVEADLTAFDRAMTGENSMFFPYLKIKDNSLVFPKVQSMEQVNNRIKFTVTDNRVDVGLLFGPGELFSQETAKSSSQNTRSTVAVEFTEDPQHLDTLRVYHANGSTYDNRDDYGKYDDLVFVHNDNDDFSYDLLFPNDESYVISYPTSETVLFNSTDPNIVGTAFTPNTPEVIGVQYKSSVDGTNWIWDDISYSQETVGARIFINLDNANIGGNRYTDLNKLAATVIEVLTKLNHSFLVGKSFEKTFFAQVMTAGNNYKQLAVKALGEFSERVKINGIHTNDVTFADGGFLNTKQAVIPIGNVSRLMPILDSIVVKTEKDWSKILRVCNSVVSIDETDSLTEEAVSKFFQNATLMLKDNEPIDVVYDRLEIRKIFKPIIGVLSLFEIKDMDFYTYSSQYTKIPEIDFYQNYYVPKETKLLDFTKYAYEVVGNGTVKINNQEYSTADPDPTVWQNVEKLQSYEVISGDAVLVQSKKLPENQALIQRHDIPIKDESDNMTTFKGFFSFGADHSAPDPKTPTYEYREKYKTNNLKSEYHVYLENFDKEFATDGRVIPYVSKWGIIDSTDARGNPYRLNSDIMFGKDNFGPSHNETYPTPEKLTHEWFYIESDFNYTQAEDLMKKNFFYFDQPFSADEMVADPTYFKRYFTYIPMLNGREIDRPQFRYSKLYRDQFSNQFSTVFNGAKFTFSELAEDGSILESTKRFEDYNFSILLKPIEEKIFEAQDLIKYRVIENVDAKSIVILIEMPIGSVENVNSQLLSDIITSTSEPWIYKFPDKRIDQLTTFMDADGIIKDPFATNYLVDYTYTSENSVIGDEVFDSIISSNYPSFSNDSFKLGRVERTVDNAWVYGGIPKADETWLIRKGTDTSKQYVVSFEQTDLFSQAAQGKFQSGAINLAAPVGITQYLKISQPKIGYLETEAAQFRIIQDQAGTYQSISLLMPSGHLSVSKVLPGFLSVFGDYRVSFNENGVSNLTYNFLYSVKDKKYNATKNAYSAVKLGLGLDLSSSGSVATSTNYFLDAKPLGGFQVADFKLEDFINPISGSHDTLTNPLKDLPEVSPPIEPPMPAFSPLMFIDKQGEISFLLNTDVTFTEDSFQTELDLGNPSKTTHALLRVTDNLLTLDRPVGKNTIVLKVRVDANSSGPYFVLSPLTFPTGSSNYWLNDTQQFQLFGGKDYFANLFESLSFSNFKLLLERNSSLVSWESYQNGQILPARKISIRVEEPDKIQKNTIVTAKPESVVTDSKSLTGGFTHEEEPSTAYDVNRYSGEYDVIYRTVSGFKQNVDLEDMCFSGANVFLNPEISDFFKIQEFSFVKYADFNILDFENSQKFEPLYPMIYESPVDFDSYDILSSSWDFNYHYAYTTKSAREKIPGSRRVTEDYSFVSKLLNVPLSFVVEEFNSVELTNEQFDIPDSDFLNLTANGQLVDLAYSVYANEIRFKINFSQAVAKALSENGLDGSTKLREEFKKFFRDESGQPITEDPVSLGNLTFDEYLYQYCKTNLLKLYSLDNIDFYEKEDRTIANNSISIAIVPYDQLDDAGYVEVKTVKINNSNSGIVVGSMLKKASAGVSLVPKLKIKYI